MHHTPTILPPRTNRRGFVTIAMLAEAFALLRCLPLRRAAAYRTKAASALRTLCADSTLAEANRDRALAYLQEHSPASTPHPPPTSTSTSPPPPLPSAAARERVHKYVPRVSGSIPQPLAIKTLLETEHGALQVQLLDVREKASFADWLLVCCGVAPSHVRAIAHGLKHDMRACGVLVDGELVSLCGSESHDWIVVDIGPVVVHVMTEHAREHYQLEQLWLPDNQAHAEAQQP